MRLTSSPRYRWAVLTMAFLGVFGAIGFGRFGYSAILPSMQRELGLSGGGAGSLASWNLAGYVVMGVIGGVLASRFGARRIVSIGLTVTAAGMLLTGLADGLVMASIGRLVTGVGSGVVLVPSIGLMSSWFDVRQRGMASGVVSSGSSLALVIVGPIVPRIIASGGSDGWRLAWYFFAAVTALLVVVNLLILRNRPARAAAPTAQDTRAGSLGLRGVFRSGYAWQLGIVYGLFGFSYMIYFTFFQKRLTADLGLTSEAAGTIFLVLGVVSLICGVFWGMVSDRIGRKQSIAMMCLLQAVAAGLFAWWPSAVGLTISAVLFGLTSVGLPGIVGAACGDRFGARLAPAALGFLTLFVGIGQAVGPYAGGLMEDAFSSLAPAYLLSAGLFIVASIVAFLLRDPRPAPSAAGCRAASSAEIGA